MPFTPEQRHAISTLNMAENFAGWLRQEAPTTKLLCYSSWQLVACGGVVQLTETERQAIQAALRKLHGKNAGPQLPRFKDARL